MNRNVTLCMSYRQSFYLYGFPVLQVTCVVTMPPSRTLCTGKEPIDNFLIKSIHFPSSFVYPSFNRSSHTLFSCVGQTTNQSTRQDLFLNLSHYQFICSKSGLLIYLCHTHPPVLYHMRDNSIRSTD